MLGIKTVTAFGLQDATVKEFANNLAPLKLAKKKALLKGVGHDSTFYSTLFTVLFVLASL